MPNAFDPSSLAKSVHDSLEDAYAAIPAGKRRALLVDASTADGVRALYVQRIGDGWHVAEQASWKGHGSKVEGRISVLKAW